MAGVLSFAAGLEDNLAFEDALNSYPFQSGMMHLVGIELRGEAPTSERQPRPRGETATILSCNWKYRIIKNGHQHGIRPSVVLVQRG